MTLIKFIRRSPNPRFDGVWRWEFWEVLDEVMKVWPHDGFGALSNKTRKRDYRSFFLSAMCGHSEKAAVCKPAMGLHQEPNLPTS